MRVGPGPVFVYEWLTTSRRRSLYAMRAGFVGLILLGLMLAQASAPHTGPDHRVSLRDLADFGEQMYRTIAVIELSLILLVAPAATAGAVCLDKARGTLDHMLATDLSNAEIVLGKLAVRLVPVLGLIACTLPVVVLLTLLGGIDPLALLGLFLAAIGCGVVGCALAMVLSIYGKKPHDVLMLTYMIILVWLMAPLLLDVLYWLVGGQPVGLYEWVAGSNPYVLAFAPYTDPSRAHLGSDLAFLAGCLAVSAVLTVLATARIRRVALRQAGRPATVGNRRRSRLLRFVSLSWLPGPSLDRNPVTWREWNRTRPSLMMRVTWGLYAAMGLLGTSAAVWPWPLFIPPYLGLVLMCAVQVGVGLLLLSVSAVTSLAEARVRGSLDVLLSTPMSTRSILTGKWWGSFRRVLIVVFWPAAMVCIPAVQKGHWGSYLSLLGLVLASGATITSLGLLLATWISRLGRAVAVCVTIDIVFVIGWPIVMAIFLSGESGDKGFIALMGDPPLGAAMLTIAMVGDNVIMVNGGTPVELVLGAILWIAVYSAVAGFLYWLTFATFDRCLGRMPEEGVRPLSRPHDRKRSSLSSDDLVERVFSSSGTPEEDLDEAGE